MATIAMSRTVTFALVLAVPCRRNHIEAEVAANRETIGSGGHFVRRNWPENEDPRH